MISHISTELQPFDVLTTSKCSTLPDRDLSRKKHEATVVAKNIQFQGQNEYFFRMPLIF